VVEVAVPSSVGVDKSAGLTETAIQLQACCASPAFAPWQLHPEDKRHLPTNGGAAAALLEAVYRVDLIKCQPQDQLKEPRLQELLCRQHVWHL